jgi:hypothetical protein
MFKKIQNASFPQKLLISIAIPVLLIILGFGMPGLLGVFWENVLGYKYYYSWLSDNNWFIWLVIGIAIVAFEYKMLDLLFKNQQKASVNKPAVSGGDASSKQSLAIINCSSPKLAYTLIYDFISKKQGQKDIDWKEIERKIVSDNNGDLHICEIIIELENKNRLTYYFDISQSMQFAQKLSDVIMSKQV